MDDIDNSYFNGVDLQKHVSEYGSYLTMHKILMKLNQLDPEIKNLYYNDSNIIEAPRDSSILDSQTNSSHPI